MATVGHVMDEIYARVSKDQRILCGRQDATGCFTCDEPLAAYVKAERPIGPPVRYLIALDGWALDRHKGIWHSTTNIEDRKRHGIPRRPAAVYPALPALIRCPKCRAVQWLDPSRLKVAPGPNY